MNINDVCKKICFIACFYVMNRRETCFFPGNFAIQLILKIDCISNILSNVCTLEVGAFGRNKDLNTLLWQP